MLTFVIERKKKNIMETRGHAGDQHGLKGAIKTQIYVCTMCKE